MSPLNRRRFLQTSASAASALAFGGSGWGQGGEEVARPNIVLIMADDLGYHHLGCYGQEHIQTPNLDRLAANGVRFTDAYAGCSVCAPSRSVLMTGYHSGHTPVRGNTGGISLRDRDITLAEILRAAGYRTGLFGKWGLGDHTSEGEPNKQGFEEFFGSLHQRHAHFYYTDYLWENDHRFLIEANRDGKRGQYTEDLILDRALGFIEKNRDQPFFCFYSSCLPHHEWVVPLKTLELYDGRFQEEPRQFRWREGYAQPARPKATMAAMVTHFDQAVGTLLDHLDRLGLTENTLVLFASDNGGADYSLAEPEFFEANKPFRDYKGSLYEGGLRIPAIAHWPGRISAGAESDHAWYFADLLATFAELAGAGNLVPSDTDGVSIAPVLTGHPGEQRKHPYLYWEIGLQNPTRAIRAGNWKAVWPGGKEAMELYDLASDPGESKDISQEHPELVADLEGLMERNHSPAPAQVEPEPPDSQYYY
jgi:arylsulfatase A-like enzyme